MTFFVSSNTFAATYNASITTSGSVTLDVTPDHDGASVVTDAINVVSTCPSGYQVSISGPADATLYKGGDSSNNTANRMIPASAGTASVPRGIIGIDSSTSTSNVGTWGYSTSQGTTINSTTFVGLTNTITPIFSSNSSSGNGGDDLSLYYGVSINAATEPGVYTMAESSAGAEDNVITYYLTTNINCVKYTIAFNPTSTAGGNTLSGTGTMDNQSIMEDVQTRLSLMEFTPPSGYEFDSWNTAQDGTGTSYADREYVTNLTTAGSTITLYAQWRVAQCTGLTTGTICYHDNGANSSTTMDYQTVPARSDEVTLWASNFQRSGYGFAGWSNSPSAVAYMDPTVTKPSGIYLYGPNETISDNSLKVIETTGLILYAIWVPSDGDLQSFTASSCAALEIGEVTALTDTRDDQTYAIAKLADGNCWMIENLRLADQALTISDTHNPIKGKGNIVTLVNVDSTGTTITSPATANHLSVSVNPTANAWCTTSNSACDDKSMVYTGNTVGAPATMNDIGGNVYSYGNYYNWYSTTAGNGTYSFGQQNNSTTGDICPYNWRLPRSGNKSNEANNDYWELIVNGLNNETLPANYSSSTSPYYTGASEAAGIHNVIRSFPNNMVNSGYARGSSVSLRGRSGTFWASTASSNNYAYRLDFDLNGSIIYVNFTTSYYKYSGYTVRCMIDGGSS